MKKELISEISRIHEIMGIEKPLLLESTCWFCKSIMDAIAELAELAKKGQISPAEYQIKINKLLNDVKNNTNLTVYQKLSLETVIKKFNELSSSADDLAKKTENARTAIYRSAEALGDLPASKYAINWVNLYKSNEFIDDFFKFRSDTTGNIEKVEKIFENSDEAGKRLSKYSSFDEYFDNALKPTFEKAYRDAGYDENMISSIVEKYRSKLKNNPKVGGKWNSPSPIVNPIVNPANAPIKRPRKVGMGDETLDPKYADKYYELIKKTGSELTDEESAFKYAVEDWKAGKEVDFENIKIKKLDDVTDDVTEGDWSSMSWEERLKKWETKGPTFITKWSGIWLDTFTPIYNLFRTFFGIVGNKTYRDRVSGDINVLIDKFFRELSETGTILTPDAFRIRVKNLLVNMQVAKNSGETFKELWENIEKEIKDAAKKAGIEGEIDEFIVHIKKGAVLKREKLGLKVEGTNITMVSDEATARGTIENFLEQMELYFNGITIWSNNLKKRKLQLGKEWDWAMLGEYVGLKRRWDQLKIDWKKVSEAGKSSSGSAIWGNRFLELMKFIWNNFSGPLLYMAPKGIRSINNALRVSGITRVGNYNVRGIKKLIGIYLGLVFLSYIYEPWVDAISIIGDWVKSVGGSGDVKQGNYFERVGQEYVKKFNESIDFNPFGYGVIPLTLYYSFLADPKEAAEKQKAAYIKQVEVLEKETIKELDNKAKEEYEKLTDQEKNLNRVRFENIKATMPIYVGDKDAKFINSRLEFVPSANRQIMEENARRWSKLKDLDITKMQEFIKQYEFDPDFKKNQEQKVGKEDVVANVLLKGKSNKYLVDMVENDSTYKLNGKPAQKYYWIKPKYEDLFKSSNKTTHEFSEFIKDYQNT